MPLLSYLATFSALGFGARCYQLAIMKRNIFDNLGGHALSVTAFTGLGYYLYDLDERQRLLLGEKKDQLLRMRQRDASIVASQAPAEHHH